MSREIRILLLFMVALAFLCYLGGIVWTGIANFLDTAPEVPEWVTYMVTGVGGALATHFGATFGLSQAAAQAQTQAAARAQKTGKSQPQDTSPPQASGSQKPPGKLQVAAAWFYVISLVLAVGFWGFDLFSPESAELLRSMSFTLGGLVIGALSVGLNVRQA